MTTEPTEPTNIFDVPISEGKSPDDLLRSKIIRACNGAIICGDDPSMTSLVRVTGLSQREIKRVFSSPHGRGMELDDIIAATGHERRHTFISTVVQDRQAGARIGWQR